MRKCAFNFNKKSEVLQNIQKAEDRNDVETPIQEEMSEYTYCNETSHQMSVSFESTSSRRIFACKSESEAILNVIGPIRQNIKGIESPGRYSPFISIDSKLRCNKCDFANTVSKRILLRESLTRDAVLLTLHNGFVKIEVVHISCESWGDIV